MSDNRPEAKEIRAICTVSLPIIKIIYKFTVHLIAKKIPNGNIVILEPSNCEPIKGNPRLLSKRMFDFLSVFKDFS